MADKEREVRERAYRIWQSEGEPAGRERDHWEQASRELGEETKGAEAAEPKKRVRKAKAAS